MVDIVEKYLDSYLKCPLSLGTMEEVVGDNAKINMTRAGKDIGVTNKQELLEFFSNKDNYDLVEDVFLLRKSMLGDYVNTVDIEMVTKQLHRFGDEIRELKIFDKIKFSIRDGKLTLINHDWSVQD